MAFTFVQANGAVAQSVALPGVSTPGDMVFFGVGTLQTPAVVPVITVTDNASPSSNTYVQMGPPAVTVDAGFNTYVFLFAAFNIKIPASGNLSVSYTSNQAVAASVVSFGEYGGPLATIQDSGSYVEANGTGTSATFSSTLIAANELLIVFGFYLGGVTVSGGWNTRDNSNTVTVLLDQLAGPSAGNHSFTPFTQGVSSNWAINFSGLYVPVPGPPATSAVFPLPVYKAIGIL